jgi:hypothetical protein
MSNENLKTGNFVSLNLYYAYDKVKVSSKIGSKTQRDLRRQNSWDGIAFA